MFGLSYFRYPYPPIHVTGSVWRWSGHTATNPFSSFDLIIPLFLLDASRLFFTVMTLGSVTFIHARTYARQTKTKNCFSMYFLSPSSIHAHCPDFHSSIRSLCRYSPLKHSVTYSFALVFAWACSHLTSPYILYHPTYLVVRSFSRIGSCFSGSMLLILCSRRRCTHDHDTRQTTRIQYRIILYVGYVLPLPVLKPAVLQRGAQTSFQPTGCHRFRFRGVSNISAVWRPIRS